MTSHARDRITAPQRPVRLALLRSMLPFRPGAAAMTLVDCALLVLVLGVIVIALAADLAALLGWLARRWRGRSGLCAEPRSSRRQANHGDRRDHLLGLEKRFIIVRFSRCFAACARP